MKKSLFFIVVFFAIALSTFAQSNSLSATAKAVIQAPLIIVDDPLVTAGTNALNFGIVNNGSALGTVVLTTQNVSSATGGVTLTSVAGTSVASFEIAGSAGKGYAITLPSSASITGPSGSTPMTVDNFTSRQVLAGADASTGTLDGTTGKAKFTVGGTLHVAANQTEGSYNGLFSVAVNYN
jgi:hypothetical protein